MSLNNSLELKNVRYIPTFKHNLLSVNKLCEDEKCSVVFHDNYCIIQDSISNKVRGIGKGENGLYYLFNEPILETLKNIRSQTLSITDNFKENKGETKVAMSLNCAKDFPIIIKDVPKLTKETL